ncbi:Uncharacterised protein [Mycobacteroides abscessus]|nr:Uncharacterised protein [Mycobacteroides abscessus]
MRVLSVIRALDADIIFVDRDTRSVAYPLTEPRAGVTTADQPDACQSISHNLHRRRRTDGGLNSPTHHKGG